MGVAVGLLAGALTGVASAAGSSAVLRNGLPPMVAPLAKSGGSAGSSSSLSRRAGSSRPGTGSPRTGTTVAVGRLPTGLAADNTTAVVANSNSNSVSIVDLTTSPASVSSTVAVGRFPVGVALSPDGSTAYVTNFKSGTLSIVDIASHSVTHTVNVGNDPDSVVQVGSTVYVANLLSGTISVVDPSAGTASTPITLTGTQTPAPSGMAASSDGHHLYVDDVRNGKMIVLDLTTSPASQLGSTSVGTYPAYLAVEGTTGYVANANLAGPTPGRVAVVDLSTPSAPRTTATVAVGSHPYGIAASPPLGEAIVSNSGDGTLTVIDTATAIVGATVPVGSTPDAVVITPDQTTALVTNEGDNTISVLHVNQPPSLSVPGAQSVLANGPSGANTLVFSGANSNALTTSDPDAGANPVALSLGVSDGTLTLGDTTGITFSAGANDSSAMTITGTLTDINAALGGLVYQPSNGFVGTDTLNATINDQGSSGDIGKPESSSATVSISVNNVAPVAGSPSFTGAIGNTTFGVGTSPSQPSTSTTGTVLTGATDANGDTLSAVGGTIPTTQGGSVSMISDGTFTYTPPVGYTGNDTFTFVISDGHTTAQGTATVTVANMVWYVNGNLATNGNGTSGNPFNALSSVTGPAGPTSAGDIIFLFGSSTPYAGNLALKGNQYLVGQSFGLNVGGAQVVNPSGADPVISAASGSDVTMADGTAIKGVDEGESAAGVTGISATNVNSFAVSSGVADTADNGVNVSGGTGTINMLGSITSSGGHSVQVSVRTGGTITFGGAVNDTGTGVSLTNNGGSTIDFTGGLVASTGTNKAFTATGGGTIDVTGLSNTLTTTTADALDVENTDIGASGLTFLSISAGTASAGPPDGIYLRSTGTTGPLTVTGTAATPASGGTIQNSTDNSDVTYDTGGDVSAVQSGPISLSNMVLSSAQQNGVVAFEVPKLTMINNQISGAGVMGIWYDNGGLNSVHSGMGSDGDLAGTFNIANNAIWNVPNRAILLVFANNAGSDSTGHVTGNTISGTNPPSSTSPNPGVGIEVDSDGNGSSVTADVSGNTIYGAKAGGNGLYAEAQDGLYGATQAPVLNLSLKNNHVDDESSQSLDGMRILSGNTGAATVCLDISNNYSKSTGTTPANGVSYDSDGVDLQNDSDTSVFSIVGGPNATAPIASDNIPVENYINGQNMFVAGPGATSQPSFAEQLGSAGFTSAPADGQPGSCPTAPAASMSAAAARTLALSTNRLRAPAARRSSAGRGHRAVRRAQRPSRIAAIERTRAARRQLAQWRQADAVWRLHHHRTAKRS